MDEIQDIRRRAGITEDEYQSVDVTTFMEYLSTHPKLSTRKAGPAVYFYPEGSIKKSVPGGYPEQYESGAVAIYHPEAPKGPFMISGGVSRGSSGYGSTHDQGGGF